MTQTLLPSNATPYELAQTNTSARMLEADTDIIRRERRADQCDAAFLPYLAWETSVHHWSNTDTAANRYAVANAFADHQSYGAPAALEIEISKDVGFPVTVREFWEFGGEWPDFRVDIPVLPEIAYAPPSDVLKSALQRKNVRDWPIVMCVSQSATGINFAAQMVSVETLKILPMNATPTLDTSIGIGAMLRIFATYTLRSFK